MIFRAIVASLLLAGSHASLDAASAPPRVTGIFSDLAYVEDSGDVLGIEVILLYSRKGYYAVFQFSEGEPSVPVVAEVTVSGNQIEFTLPPGLAYTGKFKGQVGPEGLTGHFESGQLSPRSEAEIRLRRGKSYWQ